MAGSVRSRLRCWSHRWQQQSRQEAASHEQDRAGGEDPAFPRQGVGHKGHVLGQDTKEQQTKQTENRDRIERCGKGQSHAQPRM
jgi:hypothetical protein